MPIFFSVFIFAVFLSVLALIAVYGAHRYWMVWQFWRRGRGQRPEPASRFADLPRVTVQLPMFNERRVAERAIAAACAIDYPRDKLQIQVLDDSTEESADVARRCCERMQAAGHDVEYVHRTNRHGYKAGALKNGMASATGEFIAIFDADFVPPPDVLQQTIHHFTNPDVGMVQMRWTHLNRDQSLLTRIQAMLLDGHFVVEQAARHFTGQWFNFNGTAGVWRASCIVDAGGWQHDTLTEDTDLSYRAQLNGWKFIYLPHVCCPAEIPPTVAAFISQQHRWNKGLMQTAIKLMPRIWRSDAPLSRKIEAWFHLTSPVMHVVILLLALLVAPAMLLSVSLEMLPHHLAVVAGAAFVVLGLLAAATFYIASQLALGCRVLRSVLCLPALMALGVGISAANTRAVLEALLRINTPFIRTPKFAGRGDGDGDIDPAARDARLSNVGLMRVQLPAGSVETALGVAMLLSMAASYFVPRGVVGMPFLVLFSCGFLAVGLPRLRGTVAGAIRRRAAQL